MIRPAVPADLDALRAITEAAYAPWVPVIGRRPAPMDEDHAARIAEGAAWLAPAEGEPEAAILLGAEPGALLVDSVAVRPAAQGRGLGRALLAFAEAEARRRGLPVLRLYTHARMASNLDLYRRLGWRETGRRVAEGFDRVFFEKVPGEKPA